MRVSVIENRAGPLKNVRKLKLGMPTESLEGQQGAHAQNRTVEKGSKHGTASISGTKTLAQRLEFCNYQNNLSKQIRGRPGKWTSMMQEPVKL